jgi:hypothetical protein
VAVVIPKWKVFNGGSDGIAGPFRYLHGELLSLNPALSILDTPSPSMPYRPDRRDATTECLTEMSTLPSEWDQFGE